MSQTPSDLKFLASHEWIRLIDDNVVKKIQAEEDTATCEISAAQNFLKLI